MSILDELFGAAAATPIAASGQLPQDIEAVIGNSELLKLLAKQPITSQAIAAQAKTEAPAQAEAPRTPPAAVTQETVTRPSAPVSQAPAAGVERSPAPRLEVPFSSKLRDFGMALQGQAPPDRNAQNLTYQYLLKQPGVSPDQAAAMVANPQIMQHIASQIFAPKTQVVNNKLINSNTGAVVADYSDTALQGPKTVEVEGPYGQKITTVWDAKAGKYVPVQLGAGGAPASPAAAPASQGAASPAPSQPVAPMPTQQLGVTAGAQQPVPATAPAAPAQGAAPQRNTSVTIGDGYIVGPGVPKAPEGMQQKLAPDGSGFLWTAAGKPVFESKAHATEAAKKHADDLDHDMTIAKSSLSYVKEALAARDLIDSAIPGRSDGAKYGDVIGPYAQAGNASNLNNQIAKAGESMAMSGGENWLETAAHLLSPQDWINGARKVLGQIDPVISANNSAREELNKKLTSMQQIELMSIYGKRPPVAGIQQQAAANASINVQDAATAKRMIEQRESAAYDRINDAIKNRILDPTSIEPEIVQRGIQIGKFKASDFPNYTSPTPKSSQKYFPTKSE
ncbi:MAG: hypothetical protein JSS20_15335, partial [Proteobacteria bacterium]|nr:hypothetical protein [Pseudomonadota bacterium]